MIRKMERGYCTIQMAITTMANLGTTSSTERAHTTTIKRSKQPM